ncbi:MULTISPECIES: dihydroxyacetone kinase subunit DhaL [unclassified Microbacterium]|uniref:dihydroxyacetone kinase subunit DhaL n=1 Tax=unclassified Microbacterium TaxID=2609290 RepID=UPI000CFE1655|nr:MULTISPECIES: dihydroxyacetone kinase subunit DhaL [unclassified Microbacterium]PQZ56836.1 dihydroxyacetone kinase subunit L [Microbacterium sp. MYb43]PQZ79805.1 dihydroxyacetone kinase subunit L [Microbacterium sp. MYb40]PRB20093.1 dihydroxyacetone kinase subunit L [Microbacterium sp. MYb54]PRB27377.1 dihydroxyacetone kinase subunit L [Microbacterium sp. MYb50]PRB67272.1 dihydroxyacetone kinase subunit L [Microbacterium sp. MYb24]
MAAVDTVVLADWVTRFGTAVTEKRDWLTELDSAIGDADHGANMARGMSAVGEKLAAGTPATVDELLKTVGMTLVSSVGGASGPLYGTFFLRMGMAAGPVAELDGPGLAAALRAGLEGIVARGKAEAGDKTMFDAMAPAVDAMDTALAGGSSVAEAARAAADAAAAGRDATLPLVARKGRASYLGERSAGHLDPGAASTAILFDTLAATIADSA